MARVEVRIIPPQRDDDGQELFVGHFVSLSPAYPLPESRTWTKSSRRSMTSNTVAVLKYPRRDVTLMEHPTRISGSLPVSLRQTRRIFILEAYFKSTYSL